MARLPRLCVPGWPHLVVQTAHSGLSVFRDDADARFFREALGAAAVAAGATVHAYGLREREVRLLVTPDSREALSQLMQALGRRYGAAYNRRHGHTGTLWDGRFRATVIDPERHLLEAMLFVEEGPQGVTEGTAAVHDGWTSAPHHLGRARDPMVSSHLLYWGLGNTPFDREAAYRVLADRGLGAARREQIAAAVHAGWPLGPQEFLAHLSGQVERRLAPLRRGRPARGPAVNQSDPN